MLAIHPMHLELPVLQFTGILVGAGAQLPVGREEDCTTAAGGRLEVLPGGAEAHDVVSNICLALPTAQLSPSTFSRDTASVRNRA